MKHISFKRWLASGIGLGLLLLSGIWYSQRHSQSTATFRWPAPRCLVNDPTILEVHQQIMKQLAGYNYRELTEIDEANRNHYWTIYPNNDGSLMLISLNANECYYAWGSDRTLPDNFVLDSGGNWWWVGTAAIELLEWHHDRWFVKGTFNTSATHPSFFELLQVRSEAGEWEMVSTEITWISDIKPTFHWLNGNQLEVKMPNSSYGMRPPPCLFTPEFYESWIYWDTSIDYINLYEWDGREFGKISSSVENLIVYVSSKKSDTQYGPMDNWQDYCMPNN